MLPPGNERIRKGPTVGPGSHSLQRIHVRSSLGLNLHRLITRPFLLKLHHVIRSPTNNPSLAPLRLALAHIAPTHTPRALNLQPHQRPPDVSSAFLGFVYSPWRGRQFLAAAVPQRQGCCPGLVVQGGYVGLGENVAFGEGDELEEGHYD